MLTYILLSLAGLGLMASVFSDGQVSTDTGASSTEEDGEETSPPSERADLLADIERGDPAVDEPDVELAGEAGAEEPALVEREDDVDPPQENALADEDLRGEFGEDPLREDVEEEAGPILGTEGDDTLIGTAQDDLIQAGNGADSVAAGDGDDAVIGFPTPSAEGADAGSDDLAPDQLDGGAGDDTLTGNDGDTITGGDGADIIRALGLDQPTQEAVVVTDFDPEEDVLVLVDRFGEDAVFDARPPAATPLEANNIVEIRPTPDGQSTEVLYGDEVVAVLSGTEIDTLVRETAWLVNRDAILLVQLAASAA